MSEKVSMNYPAKILMLFGLCAAVFASACGEKSSSRTMQSQKQTAENETAAIEKPADAPAGMVFVKGGEFLMGSRDGMPHEAPVHQVKVNDFWMDETEVTVKDFRRFVEATGYRTEAEKYGSSGVFDFQTGEWTMKPDANWRDPEADGKTPDENEPVCQISWNDARAYAKWAGKRLPTEAEWERAARGGLKNKTYAWGDELKPDGKPRANYWQGSFPAKNTNEDGFAKRAPVKSFPPNDFGLYEITGNVWEWTADWFDADYYRVSPAENPPGAPQGTERAMRGGSYLCADNFCTNYRVAGRSSATPDTGLSNVGFRLVKDIEK